jgi:hypothetical protein
MCVQNGLGRNMCQKPQDEISMHETDCPVELVTGGRAAPAGGLGALARCRIFNVVAVGPCQLEGPTIRSSLAFLRLSGMQTS